jgi:hypothetical protein
MYKMANRILNRSKFYKWIAIICSLIAIQTLTYFTVGLKSLRHELLTEHFAGLTHNSDSVFVRDFYVTDCNVGETKIRFSHNLSNYEDELKAKLRVNYVYYGKPENFTWADTTFKQYNLVYDTWTTRDAWNPLFDLYGAIQTEELLIDKKYLYQREAHYHWFLFFWINTFVRFETSEVPKK